MTEALLIEPTPEQDVEGEEEEENEEEEEDEEEEEEEPEQSISSQLMQDYRTLIQFLNPDQTILTLLDEQDDILSLFPELLLYTAPDRDSIGNDPYLDEIEYGRIVPFKLSTQRIVLQKKTRKRNADGQHTYHIVPDQPEESVKLLPKHERYDTTPQLSRKCIYIYNKKKERERKTNFFFKKLCLHQGN